MQTPPVQGIWKTLIVDYTNGTQIKVPYFDFEAAVAFLESQDGMSNYEVVTFTGE